MGIKLPKANKAVDVRSRTGFEPIKTVPTEIGAIPGKALSSAARALNKATQAGVSIWEIEQKERDNNLLNSKVNDYKEVNLPEMDKFRQEQGSDTDGNVERYNKKAETRRQEALKSTPSRLHPRVHKQFNLEDYHNQRELHVLRAKGQTEERATNFNRAVNNEMTALSNNPTKLAASVARTDIMVDEEVTNLTMSKEKGEEVKAETNNKLAMQAVNAVIANNPPDVAEEILEDPDNKKQFEKYLTGEQITKTRNDIKSLKKTWANEKRIKEDRAKTEKKEAIKKKQDAKADEYSLLNVDLSDEGGPEATPPSDVQVVKDFIKGDISRTTMEKQLKISEARSKGRDLAKENNSETEDRMLRKIAEITPDSTPQEVQAVEDELKSLEALGKDKGGMSTKAVNNAASELRTNAKGFEPQSFKDKMKEIDKLEDTFDFAPNFEGDEFDKKQAQSAALTNVKREVKECFNKTGDLDSCTNKALQPIREARAKEVVDRLATGFKGFFGDIALDAEEEKELEQARKTLEEAEKRKEEKPKKQTGKVKIDKSLRTELNNIIKQRDIKSQSELRDFLINERDMTIADANAIAENF